MKWTTEKPKTPEVGDRMARRAFLWMPKEIDGLVRWLEWAEWEECVLIPADCYNPEYWHPTKWTDL